ncbi:MAG: phosphate/phosphite/phosphonate ABC transporter substrate-binding protein [Spirochaetaceae bacterium]|nr:phosphate/phosphite/phosphonate ABC transporter substrate-binding protein [Spirochaetaceae bacterium]
MNFVKKRFSTVIVVIAIFSIFAFTTGCAGTGTSGSVTELRIGYLPNQAFPAQAPYRTLLEEAMSKALGIPVSDVFIPDYYAAVEAQRRGEVDIVFHGPVTYVLASEFAEALASPTAFGDRGRAGFYSWILVRADSDIRTLTDLRGRVFGFVDPNSTSGFFVPMLEIMNANPGTTVEDLRNPGRFFSRIEWSNRQVLGLPMLLTERRVDAIAISSAALATEVRTGRVNENDFRVIHKSPRIPPSVMAIRRDLPNSVKRDVRNFFLSYNDLTYFQNMYNIPPDQEPRFIRMRDRDYDYVREVMRRVMDQ